MPCGEPLGFEAPVVSPEVYTAVQLSALILSKLDDEACPGLVGKPPDPGSAAVAWTQCQADLTVLGARFGAKSTAKDQRQ